jgi:hypothetical protein
MEFPFPFLNISVHIFIFYKISVPSSGTFNPSSGTFNPSSGTFKVKILESQIILKSVGASKQRILKG